MRELRFHGRGGQGTVIASKILAAALFREGRQVQSFPAFGVERRGAPVTAFLRIDDRPILLRCEITEPDDLVILDPTLIGAVDVTAGLKAGDVMALSNGVTFTPAPGWNITKGVRVGEEPGSGAPTEARLTDGDVSYHVTIGPFSGSSRALVEQIKAGACALKLHQCSTARIRIAHSHSRPIPALAAKVECVRIAGVHAVVAMWQSHRLPLAIVVARPDGLHALQSSLVKLPSTIQTTDCRSLHLRKGRSLRDGVRSLSLKYCSSNRQRRSLQKLSA